jgi:uncharacterized protein YbjT (DUF2867 family)
LNKILPQAINNKKQKRHDLILVIGSTSFLGRYTCEMLLKRKLDFSCLVRSSSSLDALYSLSRKHERDIGFVYGDLRDMDSLHRALDGIESVIYLVRLEYRDLLDNLISAAKRRGIGRVLFISSTTVLVPAENDLKREKMESEEAVRRSGLDYTILRPSMIYGDKDDNNFSRMVSFIKRRGFFVTFGNGSNLIQPVYVEDAARAIVDCLDNPLTYKKSYEVSGAAPLSYSEMLKTVRKKLGKDFRTFRLPLSISEAALWVLNRISKKPILHPDQVRRMRFDKTYDITAARKDFSYEPVTFEEGIERLIQRMQK